MDRIRWLDDLKGLAIALIVYGHVIATLASQTVGTSNSLMHLIYVFIYSFHVPLFFFIAGLTFRKSAAGISFIVFTKKKVRRLMVPYLFWGGVCAAVFSFCGQDVSREVQAVAMSGLYSERTLSGNALLPFLSLLHAGGWPNGIGFRFNGVLWFLPMLFVCEILYFTVTKVLKDKTLPPCFVMGMCAVLLANMTRVVYDLHLPFDITRIPCYLIFLAMGDLVSFFLDRDKEAIEAFSMKVIFFAIMCLGYLILSSFLHISADTRFANHFSKQVLLASPMIALLVAIARVRVLKCFYVFAPFSIGIMLFHKFPLVCFQIALGHMNLPSLAGPTFVFVLSIVATCIIILICLVATKGVIKFAPWSLGVRKQSALVSK